MKHIAKPTGVKAVNYTPEQEAAIRAASPLNIDKAKALAETLGKSWRSVIAKAKSMDLPYEAKPAPAKRPKGMTKAELVDEIEVRTGASLSGLEKATASALSRLLESL